MSMEDFVGSLTDEQKAQLLKALTPNPKEEVVEESNTNVAEDFTMHKDKGSNGVKDRRKQPVKAKANTWTDTGEHSEIATPNVQRTPRNRP